MRSRAALTLREQSPLRTTWRNTPTYDITLSPCSFETRAKSATLKATATILTPDVSTGGQFSARKSASVLPVGDRKDAPPGTPHKAEYERVVPIVMHNGPIYFAGQPDESWPSQEEFNRSEAAFGHWIFTVWVNEHDVPTEPSDLHEFEIQGLRPEFDSFIEQGGNVPMRGASLQELWLGGQLMIRGPMTCLVNELQPEQDVSRITRLRRLSAEQIWRELLRAFANPLLDHGLNPFQVLVFDGVKMGHCITTYTIRGENAHFMDSWPGRSLLCAENNSAVAARESDLLKDGWQLSRGEFERVVFAVLRHNLAPVVEMTEDEARAAEKDKSMLALVRSMNPPGSRLKPIEGMQVISRLELAARLNRIWQVKVAINEGDDLNERGADGNTALHVAAKENREQIVRLLVEHGAEAELRDVNGKTAAEVAAAAGNDGIAKYLMSARRSDE